MKAFSFANEVLSGFHSLSFISADTAVMASIKDNCLYEVSLAPNQTQAPQPLKISSPFQAEILCTGALPASCGATPSSASAAPTSEPNQKSSFQLARASGSGDFGQTIIVVGDAAGNVTFLYCDVAEMGEEGEKIQIRKTKGYQIKELISLADEQVAITSLSVLLPRGENVVAGTETGHLVLFTLTSGVYQFKQLLRNDLQSPIHSIISIKHNKIAFSYKNQLQIINVSRPESVEFEYKCASSITTLAYNGYVLAIGAEQSGVVFIDEENIEISAFPAPENDSISSLSVSEINEEFVCATHRGELIVFRGNGILRDVLTEDEMVGESAGGVLDVKCTAEGGEYIAVCHSGIEFGYLIPERLNLGRVVAEMIDLNKIKFTDNIVMVNDFYTSPEPILGLFASANSNNIKIMGVTASSVILWSLPDVKKSIELRTSDVSASLRTAWIEEPLRTQSYTESLQKINIQQEQQEIPSAAQSSVVGGVRFEGFDFSSKENDKSNLADYSAVSKSALFIRHSVIFACISNDYVMLQDVSGECHCCAAGSLALIHTIYNGICNRRSLCLSDDVCVLVDGSSLRVTETHSGSYVIKNLTHQRRITSVCVSSFDTSTAQSKGGSIEIQGLGTAALGFNVQTTAQSSQDAVVHGKRPILAFVDSSSALFTHELHLGSGFYEKHTETSTVFMPYPMHSKVLAVQFPYASQLLVVLVTDSASYSAPEEFLGGSDNPDYNTRLRLAVIAHPCILEASLPPNVFHSAVSVNLGPVLKQAAGISYDIQSDNSSRQIAQFKLLCRQNSYEIGQIEPAIQTEQITKFKMCSFAVINILNACSCTIALPEFPYILEKSTNLQLGIRLCRYIEYPALWSELIEYAKERCDTEALEQSLAAVEQIPKALFETTDSVAELLKQNRTAKAVALCCDLWDFEKAREIVESDRRCGPVLVYLRRQLHNELGGIADEKTEPWVSLAREFGDKANESCMTLIQ